MHVCLISLCVAADKCVCMGYTNNARTMFVHNKQRAATCCEYSLHPSDEPAHAN